EYGSEYPGVNSRGVHGRNLPFYFWPVVWEENDLNYNSNTSYLYGPSNDTSRPGGALQFSVSTSNSTTATPITLWVSTDETTLIDLLTFINTNCSFASTSTMGTPFGPGEIPHPEEAVQYYRARSVVLGLEGYNNTAIFSAGYMTDVLLPTVDNTLLDCANQMIGRAVPLVKTSSNSAKNIASICVG
ncbi:hypothetical protein B0H17DRAFT_933236, partial [Mycena rosella]